MGCGFFMQFLPSVALAWSVNLSFEQDGAFGTTDTKAAFQNIMMNASILIYLVVLHCTQVSQCGGARADQLMFHS